MRIVSASIGSNLPYPCVETMIAHAAVAASASTSMTGCSPLLWLLCHSQIATAAVTNAQLMYDQNTALFQSIAVMPYRAPSGHSTTRIVCNRISRSRKGV